MATHRRQWDRLEELVRALERRGRRAGVEELDELVRLYLRTSSHLSTVRTTHRDPGLVVELSRLVGRANALVYGTRATTWQRVGRWWTEVLPAAVWHVRREVLLAAAVFLVAALVAGTWLASTPEALALVGNDEELRRFAEEDFVRYYSDDPAALFGASVFTNNARVGLTAFAVGIAGGVPTLLVLLLNGVNVGVAGAVLHSVGLGSTLYVYILPHGLLELSAIFVAGGAGLRLGWAVVAPGDRTRPEALRQEGQRAVTIVLGLVAVFLLAALVEAFVTPSKLPAAVRLGIGTTVWASAAVWLAACGRAAAGAGVTGALEETTTLAGRRGYSAPDAFRSR
ncbi:MAG: stage II sporulation protein M [Actinomycetes bacterium]